MGKGITIEALALEEVGENLDIEELIEAVEREVADGTFQAINAAELVDDGYRFVVERLQAALAAGGAIDVGMVVRVSYMELLVKDLEAEGLAEKTGEMRPGPISGKLLPVYRVKYRDMIIPDRDSQN